MGRGAFVDANDDELAVGDGSRATDVSSFLLSGVFWHRGIVVKFS